MAQPRFCPRCGTPMVADQRFCARCGLAIPAKTDDVRQDQLSQQFSPVPLTPRQSSSQTAASGGNTSTSFPSPPTKTRTFGRGGLILVLLVFLVVMGIGSYVGAGLLGLPVPGFGNGKSTTQSPITTTQVNTTVTYAGVD